MTDETLGYLIVIGCIAFVWGLVAYLYWQASREIPKEDGDAENR